MGKNILSQVGFMTQDDKTDFDKNFELLVSRTEELERDVVNLNTSMTRLEQKLDKIFENIDENTNKQLEIKNNMQVFNQSQRQLIKEIDSKFSQLLKSQFEDIQNKISEQRTFISSFRNSLASELNQFFGFNNNKLLTKEDLQVIESFLRLIAANQLIQETYFDTTNVKHESLNDYDEDDVYAPYVNR